MEKKKRDEGSWTRSVPIYLWVLFFGSMLLAGVTTYAFLRQNAKVGVLEERIDTIASAYDDCNYKLRYLQKSYQTLKADFDQLDKDYESCKLSLILKDGDIKDLNTKLNTVVEYLIHYDRLIMAMQYYAEVNTCADFISGYYDMKNYAQEYIDFVKKNGDILEEILTDELAEEYGYDYGFKRYDAINMANQFLSNLDYTYNYCMGG